MLDAGLVPEKILLLTSFVDSKEHPNPTSSDISDISDIIRPPTSDISDIRDSCNTPIDV